VAPARSAHSTATVRALCTGEGAVVDAADDPVVGVALRVGVGIDRRLGVDDRRRQCAGRRLERGPGAQRFELAGAEPDRLGALPRQVAVQAKLALQLRRGQARDREDEERDQRLEQGGRRAAWR
jgi:hypothetical protein